jgi:hypothetical protein
VTVRLGRVPTLLLWYAAAVAIAVGGAEWWLRRHDGGDRCLGEAPPGAGRAAPAAYYARPDRELGWVTAPRAGEVNPQGFRDPRPFTAPAGATGARRVLVLGDSFMWGSHLVPADTVPRRLEAALGPGWEVANVSAPGWGLDQMYLAYRRYRDVLRPSVVVLAFIDDDVHRVLDTYRPAERLTKPAFDLVDEALVLRTGPPARGAATRLLRRSVVFRCAARTVRRATTARALARHLLGAVAREAGARGERLVVVRIPDGHAMRSALGRAWWRRRDLTDAAVGATRVEVFPALAAAAARGRVLYVEDGHLNAAGSAMLAALLAPPVRHAADDAPTTDAAGGAWSGPSLAGTPAG